jgi:multidrug resistance efflux pump
MSETEPFPQFARAVKRHLSQVRGLRGVNAFLREAGVWKEAVRLGEVLSDRTDETLDAFDPQAAGAVDALTGGNGWAATYMTGGPGLDLLLLMHLDGLAPSELQAELSIIEARVGWLMLAALSDRASEIEGVALGTEIGAQILLDAARAGSRRQLAEQWVARLEEALKPNLMAVAWLRGGRPRLDTVSGGALVERKSDGRTQLEALAEYAVERRAPCLVEAAPAASGDMPEPDEMILPDPARQTANEDALARLEALGSSRGLAMPIYLGDEPAAVVIAAWAPDTTAGPVQLDAADLIAQVLGESLSIQSRSHPSLWRRLANWLVGWLRAIFGPTAWKLKVAAVFIATTLVVLALWPSRYEPTFTARIEAVERRVVAAPYDGFLAEAPNQLGDTVAAGELLVAMADTELRLQQAQAESELAEIEAEIQTAQAQRNTAEVQSLDARRRQVQVRLDLLDDQLDMARVEAERDVIVVGGDAWRRVGGRVRLGEPLLELAEPGAFRVLAFVHEDWITDLPEGVGGALLLTAYPTTPIPVTLDAITTAAEMQEGINTFPAWMDVAEMPDLAILDGMRGVVRMQGERTSLLLAYTRGLRRWIERQIWRWT